MKIYICISISINVYSSKKCILYIPNLALMETDGMYDDIHMSENHGYIRGYEWNIHGTI